MDSSLFPDLQETAAAPAADLRPMIVDSFAGGGGASTGIELVLGRSPDVAINHDAAALALHQGLGQRADEPLHTLSTRDTFGLVTVEIDGTTYAIADIGLRMLTPREMFRAQGFPDSYEIGTAPDGRTFTRTGQTRMCGNSVCPPLAAALARANCGHLDVATMHHESWNRETI